VLRNSAAKASSLLVSRANQRFRQDRRVPRRIRLGSQRAFRMLRAKWRVPAERSTTVRPGFLGGRQGTGTGFGSQMFSRPLGVATGVRRMTP